jgi:hypothetical protein
MSQRLPNGKIIPYTRPRPRFLFPHHEEFAREVRGFLR